MSSLKTMTNMSKYFLNKWFIKSMKASGALREPYSLHKNKIGAPHRDTLDLMNPLSKRSFNCSFNSLSFVGSILYGEIDMGGVSGRRLILKTISHLGGTPGRFLGNKSRNSHTTNTDSRVGVSEVKS
ncbi:hypothetical protein T459_30386 [Capsicum annuum]|uniref:Uncharacterized protein n=1 Tax=Capsicum annuum TaxID=4072 RepID=A0A2G2Y8T3_CAPAN|nr:hypothetical protein T459_30386 [Capsicum annuum]